MTLSDKQWTSVDRQKHAGTGPLRRGRFHHDAKHVVIQASPRHSLAPALVLP